MDPELSGPTLSNPSLPITAMVPPPAPKVRISSIGVAISWLAIWFSLLSNICPPTMTPMSALVPPMSKVRT
jgi:hypothetical protein